MVEKLGLTHADLEKMSMLVETVRTNPIDRNGVLRIGVMDKTDDGKMALRHGIGPDEFREAWLKLPEQAQNAIIAVLTPSGGWPSSVELKLPGKGYRYDVEHPWSRPYTVGPPPDGRLLHVGQPMKRFFVGNDDVFENIVSFLKTDSKSLKPSDYVWLGKAPKMAADEIGLPPNMDVVLPQGYKRKGAEHLRGEHKTKNYTPEELAEAAIRCMDPTEIREGFTKRGKPVWLFIRRNGKNDLMAAEATINEGYVQVTSVVPDMKPDNIDKWIKKGQAEKDANRAGQPLPASFDPQVSPQADSLASPVDNSSLMQGIADVKALDEASPSAAKPSATGRSLEYWQNLYKQYIDAFGPAEALEKFLEAHAGDVPAGTLRGAGKWLAKHHDDAQATAVGATEWGAPLLLPEPPKNIPRTVSRQALHEDLVKGGVLQPGQHREGYFTHMSPRQADLPELALLVIAGLTGLVGRKEQ